MWQGLARVAAEAEADGTDKTCTVCLDPLPVRADSARAMRDAEPLQAMPYLWRSTAPRAPYL